MKIRIGSPMATMLAATRKHASIGFRPSGIGLFEKVDGMGVLELQRQADRLRAVVTGNASNRPAVKFQRDTPFAFGVQPASLVTMPENFFGKALYSFGR
jgi:hypothetical protein